MKNLKKVLCLALVLVMTCGLLVSANAAEFNDGESIKYTEAVDVLSGIGIIEGFTDGSFMPKGDVTRAQAAKIIAYLLLGKDSADALSTNVSPFKDVPAGHWAAGYIQYCTNQGIINGKGSGVFAPSDKVTNVELAKMLLVALGYGSNDEFIGAGWKSQVAKYAAKALIFKGNYAAGSDSFANREEACLYAFNTLFANKVVYSSLIGDYLTTGLGLAVGYGTFADQYGLKQFAGTVSYTAGIGYIANGVKGIDGSPADIGRNVMGWYQDNGYAKTAVVTYYADTVLATKYDGMLAAWQNNALPAFVGTIAATAEYYLNGVKQAAPIAAANKGEKWELIDSNNDKVIDKILVTTYKAAAITAVPVVTTVGAVNYVTIAGITTGVPAATVDGYADLAIGDVVYYNVNGGTGVTYITKATTVVGQKSAQIDTTGAIIFGGANYTANAYALKADLTALAFNTDATLFLDAAGYVIDYKLNTAAAEAKYAIVDDITVVAGSGIAGTAYIEARLVYTDGKAEIVKISAVTFGGVKYTAANLGTAQITAIKGTWFTYTATDSVYALTAAAATAGNTSFTMGVPAVAAGVVANDKTVFVVKMNGAVAGTYTYGSYTGYKAMPSLATGTTLIIKNAYVPGVANYVFVDATADANFGSVTNYAFVTGKNYVTYATATGAKYYAYTAVVDGAKATLNLSTLDTDSTAAGEQKIDLAGIYAVTYDTAGYATLSAVAAGKAVNFKGAELTYAANGVLGIAANFYAYSSTTAAYIYNTVTGALTVGTVEDIVVKSVTAGAIVLNTAGTGAAAIYVVY